MFITLDGVVEAPEKWNPLYYDDELNQAVMTVISRDVSATLAKLKEQPNGNGVVALHYTPAA